MHNATKCPLFDPSVCFLCIIWTVNDAETEDVCSYQRKVCSLSELK